MVDSTPPAMIASASPRWIIFQASPMLWLPVAQAVTTELLGPLAPKRMEICPGASFTMSMGMKKGEIRPGPFSRRTLWKDSIVVNPPSPAPTTTPTRSAFSGVILNRESSMAMTAAAMAYWIKISMRRPSFLSINFSGSKSLTSAAIWVSNPVESNRVMRPTPDFP